MADAVDPTGNGEPDPWVKMKDLIGTAVEEKLNAWQPPAGNNSPQPSPSKTVETPPVTTPPVSTDPDRSKSPRKEGFLSQFFKGLE